MGSRPATDGRGAILVAARALFARHGLDAVSIRSINREAGLGAGAVHYHFGTKENLVAVVLAEPGARVLDEVRARARRVLEDPGVPRAHDVVSCVGEAYVELLERDGAAGLEWIRVVNQFLRADPSRVTDPESTELMNLVLRRAFPDREPDQLARALEMCVTLLIGQLSRLEPPSRPGSPLPSDAREAVDFLVEFLSGGMVEALAPHGPGKRMG